MNELHTLLHDALAADAERAPELPHEWVGPTTATLVPIGSAPRGRRLLVAAGGIAAAAAAIAAIAVVARPDEPPAPADEPAPAAWQPPGAEFPIVDLGPATESLQGPVVAALTRDIQVDGHPVQTVSTSLTYQFGATAELQYCTSENGGSGCRPEWNTAKWSFSVTSSVDNGDAEYDLFTIEGLPAGVAYVGYVDGDTRLWQRPIAGFAAFPNVVGADEVLTAWDASGTVIDTYDQESARIAALTVRQPLTADISQDDYEGLLDLTWSSMGACLTGHGGTVGDGGVATFPDDVDQVAVWDACVSEVKATVGQAVTDLSPRFFDPATESPENPDTPFG